MSRLNVANFRHPDGTADNINLDSSGQVGIGTSSPDSILDLEGAAPTITLNDTNGTDDRATLQSTGGALILTARDGTADGEIIFKKFDGTTTDETARITNAGNLQFDSGYGSVATAFGVRAWINFDGTAATIGSGRASGNMDAVTDNGTGDYTINFTNDMPDANYCVQISIELDDTVNTNNFGVKNGSTPAVGSVRVAVGHESGTLDTDRYFVSIIR